MRWRLRRVGDERFAIIRVVVTLPVLMGYVVFIVGIILAGHVG